MIWVHKRNSSKTGFLPMTSFYGYMLKWGGITCGSSIAVVKHMTGDQSKFLSLSTYHGGTVTFGDNLTSNIVAVGKIGKSLSHYIDSVFLVEGLKHSLLNISQFYDKGNIVKFTNESCVVSNKSIGTKILEGTRKGNTYMVDLNLVPRNNLTRLSVIEEDPLLWLNLFWACINFFFKQLHLSLFCFFLWYHKQLWTIDDPLIFYQIHFLLFWSFELCSWYTYALLCLFLRFLLLECLDG